MNRKIFYVFLIVIPVIVCFSIYKKRNTILKKHNTTKEIEVREVYRNLDENKENVFLENRSNQCGFRRLPEKYCVYFGNEDSLNSVTEYYSFTCSHCLNLYKKEFEKIKNNLIKENRVNFAFHPVPLDLVTIQAMICLERLSSEEKCLFLDAILSEADLDSFITANLMQKAMELLNKPIPQLLEEEFVVNHTAFQDAFDFITQENSITAIPSVDINGRLFSEEIPEYLFITAHIEG